MKHLDSSRPTAAQKDGKGRHQAPQTRLWLAGTIRPGEELTITIRAEKGCRRG